MMRRIGVRAVVFTMLVAMTAQARVVRLRIERRDAVRNGRVFYEVGNRGGKGMLSVFQKAKGSRDPSTAAEFGDGALMMQGYSLLWMGWQWDVPEGQMRMNMPIASDHGAQISGLVRGNFILNKRAATASVADRNHKAYEAVDPASAENFMTVRDLPP